MKMSNSYVNSDVCSSYLDEVAPEESQGRALTEAAQKKTYKRLPRHGMERCTINIFLGWDCVHCLRALVVRRRTLLTFQYFVFLVGVGFEYYICGNDRSEEHTSELQSLMRISYAVF